MFAVIKTGGKQYRVAPDDVLKIARVAGEPGAIVQLGEVLVVGGDSVVLGSPTVAGASVAVELLEQARGPKVITFKKRRRKNSRRKRGYRDEYSLVRVAEILTDGKKPTVTAKPKAAKAKPAKPEAEAAEAGDAAAAPKKKAAAKPAAKTAAKAAGKTAGKTAAKAPAKKPAAKPAAKTKK
jgi:large subunit ribosomal protein L21